MAKGGNDTSSD